MARNKSVASVTIASGASLSGGIDLGDKVLSAIIMPAAWTAAALSFQASEDNGVTWLNMFDDGGVEVQIATVGAVAGQRIALDPSMFSGVDFVKVRSGLSTAAVNQAADRVFTLVSRKFYSLS